MKARLSLVLVVVLILTLGFNIAHYLIVSRNATLKEKPNGDASIVGRVKEGAYLKLLSTEQTNGYFHVNVPNTSIQGWVYRTFVRRYKGEFPVGKYIIYDAGHYRGSGKTTLNQLKEVIPAGSTIEQLILSHTDGDHIG